MTEALILVSIVLGSVLTMITLNKRRIANQEQELQVSINTLISLKDLLILIQQHRGLSTGYLNGQHAVNNHLRQTAEKIDSQWHDIHTNFPFLEREKLCEGIYSHWSRLKTRWKEQSISNNIQQHNRLITNLLYLIENQAEKNALLTFHARDSGLDIAWKELLETIEAIGQTRAIGMGIIGEGKSTAVERIQIQFLIEKVNSRLERLAEVFIDTINTDWSIDYTKQAKEKAVLLNAFIEAELLTNKRFKTSNEGASELFFKLASDTIAPLDALFVKATKSLKNNY